MQGFIFADGKAKPWAFTQAEEAVAIAAAEKWKIVYFEHFLCVACSDGGIDDNRNRFYRTIQVTPEMIVLRDGEAVGVCCEDGLFLFDAPETHQRKVVLTDEYVGGWGDVTETAHYLLKMI